MEYQTTRSEGVIPLSMLDAGQKGVVVALNGGADFQQRVTSLGLYPGCEVEVVGGGCESRMLLAIGDTRIALGHGMAEKVLVS